MSAPLKLLDKLHWMQFCGRTLVLLASQEVKDTHPLQLLTERLYIRHERLAAVELLVEEWISKNKIRVRNSTEMQSLKNLANMVVYALRGVDRPRYICA